MVKQTEQPNIPEDLNLPELCCGSPTFHLVNIPTFWKSEVLPSSWSGIRNSVMSQKAWIFPNSCVKILNHSWLPKFRLKSNVSVFRVNWSTWSKIPEDSNIHERTLRASALFWFIDTNGSTKGFNSNFRVHKYSKSVPLQARGAQRVPES